MADKPNNKYGHSSGGHKSGEQRQHQGHYNKWSETEADEVIKKYFGNEFVSLILSENKPSYNNYIDSVKRYVEDNKKGMTTSQLRNVYSRIKKLELTNDLYALRPKIAYVAGRAERHELKTFLYLIDILIKNIDDDMGAGKKLQQFKDFFEAIIAYHKYYGGDK